MSLDTIVNGLLVGGLYAVIALSISLIFGVMRLINLAQGEFVIGGAFLIFFLSDSAGFAPLLALPVAAVVLAVVAYPVQRLLLAPVLARGPEPAIVATFGLSLLIQSLLIAAFTSDGRSLPTGYGSTGFEVAGLQVRTIYVGAFAAGIVLVGALHVGLTRTRHGTALRAAAVDPGTAATMGIDPERLRAASFSLAAALAVVAGFIIGVAFGFAPTTGLSYLLKGFAVVVLGGVGSIGGTLAGGLLLGVLEGVAADQLGGEYRDLTVFLFLLLLLAVRPTGLFGRAA